MARSRVMATRFFYVSGLSPTYSVQESPANGKGTRDSSACMKAHCEQM